VRFIALMFFDGIYLKCTLSQTGVTESTRKPLFVTFQKSPTF